jgi:uncharacterized integral membrane protein
MGSYVKAILLLIVLVGLVTFGINNLEPIRLHYYFKLSSMPLPLYGVVYGAIIIGIFIGMLVGINSRFGQRKKIKELKRENRELQAKVGAERPEEKIEDKTGEEQPAPTPEDESDTNEETQRF